MDAAAELGGSPVYKRQNQPEYGDEQADAGRDCRTCLARPTSQGANGDREKIFFPVQLTTSRVVNLTRLILTLAVCDDQIYIHSNTIPSRNSFVAIVLPWNLISGS